MSATYSQLRDKTWGIRVIGPLPSGTVTVTKKDGTTKTETIDKVLWSAEDGQTHLCSIVRTAQPARSGRGGGYRRGDGGPRGNKACYMCGSYYCDGARGGLCEDD